MKLIWFCFAHAHKNFPIFPFGWRNRKFSKWLFFCHIHLFCPFYLEGWNSSFILGSATDEWNILKFQSIQDIISLLLNSFLRIVASIFSRISMWKPASISHFHEVKPIPTLIPRTRQHSPHFVRRCKMCLREFYFIPTFSVSLPFFFLPEVPITISPLSMFLFGFKTESVGHEHVLPCETSFSLEKRKQILRCSVKSLFPFDFIFLADTFVRASCFRLFSSSIYRIVLVFHSFTQLHCVFSYKFVDFIRVIMWS